MALTKEQKEQQAIVTNREDLWDVLLWKALEVSKMPSKWKINTKTGELVEVFPVPVFRQNCTIQAIEYRENKSFMLPNALLDRLIANEDLIESVEHKAEKEAVKKAEGKAPQGRHKKCSPELIKEMVELKEAGATYRELTEKFGVSSSTLSNYILEYRKEQEEATA